MTRKQLQKLILDTATICDEVHTGGCRPFYSPQEWKEHGEEYGTDAVLIVVYDGGDLRYFFNPSAEWGASKLCDKMRKALAKHGYYYEQCTGWYSAIYKKDN